MKNVKYKIFQDLFSISVFGNPDYPMDSLPIRLLPNLQMTFPEIQFIIEDPTEGFDSHPDPWWIIDTVQGIETVTIFTNIDDFILAKNVTVHDYDLLLDLKLLEKQGKLGKVRIIGLPSTQSEKNVLHKLTTIIHQNFTKYSKYE